MAKQTNVVRSNIFRRICNSLNDRLNLKKINIFECLFAPVV